jgi:CRISPR/Cas system Type II protein with McrA/HNH and RuvC-like nuclease domain
MSRCGKSNYERFPIRKDENGNYLCRMCGKILTGRKTSFCGQDCLDDFFMKTHWPTVRKKVYERDKGICQICGKKVDENDYHVDHIFPISKGGDEWDMNNLQCSCPECNLKKSDKII